MLEGVLGRVSSSDQVGTRAIILNRNFGIYIVTCRFANAASPEIPARTGQYLLFSTLPAQFANNNHFPAGVVDGFWGRT